MGTLLCRTFFWIFLLLLGMIPRATALQPAAVLPPAQLSCVSAMDHDIGSGAICGEAQYSTFSWYVGERIGEARHPGPKSQLRISSSNPGRSLYPWDLGYMPFQRLMSALPPAWQSQTRLGAWLRRRDDSAALSLGILQPCVKTLHGLVLGQELPPLEILHVTRSTLGGRLTSGSLAAFRFLLTLLATTMFSLPTSTATPKDPLGRELLRSPATS